MPMTEHPTGSKAEAVAFLVADLQGVHDRLYLTAISLNILDERATRQSELPPRVRGLLTEIEHQFQAVKKRVDGLAT